MEGFQDNQHEDWGLHPHLEQATPTPVPSALLPTVLQRLGLEGQSTLSFEQAREDIRNPDWQKRAAAVRTLGKLNTPEAQSLLLPALDDEDSSVRAAALHALGQNASSERLFTALHDEDWHVRETAIFIVGQHKQKRLPDALALGLRDTDVLVREAAQMLQNRQQTLQPLEQPPTNHRIDLFAPPSPHSHISGQQMSMQPQERHQPHRSTSLFSPFMQKKDRKLMRQEQEQSFGQEPEQPSEYRSYDPYRNGLSERWEKATSYPSYRRPFRSRWYMLLGMVIVFVIAGIIGWAVAVITPFSRTNRIIQVQGEQATALPFYKSTVVPQKSDTLYTYLGHSGYVYAVAWSPNGSRIASASADGTVQVWDATTGATMGANIVVHRGNLSSYSALAWSPDGKYIASSSATDPTVEIWNAATGATTATYQLQGAAASVSHIGAALRLSGGCGTGVYQVAWSPDGTRLALAGGYQTHGIVEVLNALTGNILLTYTAHASCVDALSWSHDGKYIVTGSFDGTVNVWDAATGKTLYQYATTGTNDIVESAAWSPDDQRIALSMQGQSIGIWDPFNNQKSQFTTGPDVFQIAWSPDGQRLAAVGPTGDARIWNASTGANLAAYNSNAPELFAVAWSPDGRMLAAGGMNDAVQIWQV